MEGEIQVFDQNGKLLFSRTAKPGRNRVDMSRYASGIYFVRLRDDNDQ
ncbi:MAG: T9SS type A sorting domain-containing protein, partial [Bacteroidales bacterium]|nr:T9SS type A sorting domain-containing protein [Bacteroidales bacterium]